MEKAKWMSGIFYLISILLGNFFVIWFGIVKLALMGVTGDPTYFVLIFPAGAVFIGLTFSARDFAQRYWGHWKVWLWMILSAVITLVLNWQVAVASVSAFLISETIDWFVYFVMKKDLKWRVIVSNLFSCPMDSFVFVTIAFGWVPEAIFGQAIIKYLSGLLVIPFIPKITKAYDQLGEKFVGYF